MLNIIDIENMIEKRRYHWIW